MDMSEIRVCSKSVMDSIADPDISFDENGVSNYFYEYVKRKEERLFDSEASKHLLEDIVEKIKKDGEGKPYDCIVGVSGGVDSTYVAYLTKELGLRPLAVHLDNGWNSELAVSNIQHVLNGLDIDLITHVLDWEEFKSLQLAFLRSATPDGEIPTDHAIFALLFEMANQMGIRYIMNGNNFATESVMPPTWAYGHIDWKYIKSINKRFGTKKLRTYPRLTPIKYLYMTLVKRVKIISILNYVDYRKADTMALLQDKLGWKYYGGKHYESVYTRFYQGHYLVEKFGIDKRKAHLSTLIFSGQISREQALEELKKPIYPPGMLEEDKSYVKKKFDLNDAGFDELMKLPNRCFRDYPNQSGVIKKFRAVLNYLRGKRIVYS